jgi:hypothetical protein
VRRKTCSLQSPRTAVEARRTTARSGYRAASHGSDAAAEGQGSSNAGAEAQRPTAAPRSPVIRCAREGCRATNFFEIVTKERSVVQSTTMKRNRRTESRIGNLNPTLLSLIFFLKKKLESFFLFVFFVCILSTKTDNRKKFFFLIVTWAHFSSAFFNRRSKKNPDSILACRKTHTHTQRCTRHCLPSVQAAASVDRLNCQTATVNHRRFSCNNRDQPVHTSCTCNAQAPSRGTSICSPTCAAECNSLMKCSISFCRKSTSIATMLMKNVSTDGKR